MKKKILSIILLIAVLCSCVKKTPADFPKKDADTSYKKTTDDKKEADVDLSVLSDTVVYAELVQISQSPDDYIGKKIKMKGQFAAYPSTEFDGVIYFVCNVSDATACCSMGMEFILKGDAKYPDDYPAEGSEITICGTFNTYYEGANLYCHLEDTEII